MTPIAGYCPAVNTFNSGSFAPYSTEMCPADKLGDIHPLFNFTGSYLADQCPAEGGRLSFTASSQKLSSLDLTKNQAQFIKLQNELSDLTEKINRENKQRKKIDFCSR